MPILISGLQNRAKNSAAYAEDLGLMLIANGEELPYTLTPAGEVHRAGIEPFNDAPDISINGGGNLTDTKWVVYVVVYVAENVFPLVGLRIFSPVSDQSDPFQITGGDRELKIEFDGSVDPIVNKVFVYRTSVQDTSGEAQVAADAGLMYKVGEIANASGGLEILDNTLTIIGNDIVDLSVFVSSQFRFVVYDGSYFWGWANHPFNAEASWEMDGTITLSNPALDKFWGGRNDQFITFSGINSGGIDNRGTFLFQQLTDYTGKVVDEDGADLTLPSATTGDIVIIGPSATLYRSAFRNPFNWGYITNIAGFFVPSEWILKVSGALGTAIAIVPDQQLLKLDMEFPALCITYSLQSAGVDLFSQTRRQVSRLHSVTSHFSQFVAISNGRQQLWGFDAKNAAIISSDGYTQIPISGPISVLLKTLSKNRALHLLTHGIYDPETEINALWLSTSAVDEDTASFTFDLCVYQHGPTGFWGVFPDYGILCSASIEDVVSSRKQTLVGTESGFLGRAFDSSTFGNWLPLNSLLQGQIRSATSQSITRSENQDDFNPTDAGLIGNFCIITNPTGGQSQIAKIVDVIFDTLFFDKPLFPVPITTSDPGTLQEDQQWKFFIGLIELRVLKYFDGGKPSVDKAPREYWATLSDAEFTTLEYYLEHETNAQNSIILKQDTDLDSWRTKFALPTRLTKTFGLALVERSYNNTKFYNFVIT